MGDQPSRKPLELFWSIGTVIESDRHDDRLTLYLAPILQRYEKPSALTLD